MSVENLLWLQAKCKWKMDVCILLKNASDNESLEWLCRGQKGHACTAVLWCQFLLSCGEWGLRFAPHLLRGQIQNVLHFLIRQTILLTALPRANTGSLHSQYPACHTLCPATSLSQAILTEEINTRLYNIFPSTSLALQRDNYLYWKCWDHPEANSYMEDWDCPNKHCVLKAAATTVTLLFSQKRVASLLCTN